MIRIIVRLVLAFSFLILLSCNKDEGTGGEGSIKGTVIVKNFDRVYKTVQSSSPAIDQDVFIIYGENGSLGDRTRTSNTGEYEFKYLRDGKYKVYIFSDDTTGVPGKKLTIEQIINVVDGKAVTAEQFLIFNGLDFNDGSGKITGRIYKSNFDRAYKTILDTLPAVDQDVFIVFGNNKSLTERTRTSSTGDFEFNYLVDGKYTIYTISDDTTGVSGKKLTIEQTINVVEGKTFTTDSFFIFNGLDFNDGSNRIGGRIFKSNFDRVYKTILDTFPAIDQDVFIVFGDNKNLTERTRTSSTGDFEFNYLIDGKYTIYTISDDTTVISGKNITVEQTITVKGKKSVTTDNFFVYNGLDYNDGSAKIFGRVYVYNYNKSGTILTGQYWGQDVDVFITHGDKPGYDDKISTSHDGTFEFPNLIKGNYKVFVYSAHKDSNGNLDGNPEDAVIIKNITITSDNQKVDLGTMNIEKL